MNKNIAIVLGIVVILIIVIVYGGTGKNDDAMMNDTMMEEGGSMMGDKDAMMEDKKGSMMDSGEGMMESSGSYETYEPQKLALADSGDVVLFFRASWCPTCRALDADIRASMKNIPAGVTILDVNYDNSTALKQKYGVTYQHTLVQVDSSGNQIAKWMGSPTLASLVTNIK